MAKRKNSYRLDCNWFQTQNDVDVEKADSWVGFISVYDDNSCIGCAIDARRTKPTHLLTGTMVNGKGLILNKIHVNNPNITPSVMDFYSNVNQNKDLMFGVYYDRIFPVTDLKKGLTVVKINQINDLEQINNIEQLYTILATKVMRNGGRPAMLLNALNQEDHKEYTDSINQIYETLKDAKLPEILINKSQNQPGNN